MGQKVKLKMSTCCMLMVWFNLILIIFSAGCINCAISMRLENNNNQKGKLILPDEHGSPLPLLTTTEQVPNDEDTEEVEETTYDLAFLDEDDVTTDFEVDSTSPSAPMESTTQNVSVEVPTIVISPQMNDQTSKQNNGSSNNTSNSNVEVLSTEKKGKFLDPNGTFKRKEDLLRYPEDNSVSSNDNNPRKENNMLSGAAVLTFAGLDSVTEPSNNNALTKNVSSSNETLKALMDWAEIIKNVEQTTTHAALKENEKLEHRTESLENDVLDHKISNNIQSKIYPITNIPNGTESSNKLQISTSTLKQLTSNSDNELETYTKASNHNIDKLSTHSYYRTETPLIKPVTEPDQTTMNNKETSSTTEMDGYTSTDRIFTTNRPNYRFTTLPDMFENLFTTTTEYSTTLTIPEKQLTTISPWNNKVKRLTTTESPEEGTTFVPITELPIKFSTITQVQTTSTPLTVSANHFPTTTTESISIPTSPLSEIITTISDSRNKNIPVSTTRSFSTTDTIPTTESTDIEQMSGSIENDLVSEPSVPENQEGNTDLKTILVASLSVVGLIALILLIGFLYVIRKRQKQVSYGQRCRPVSLDAYSLDNVSVYNSVRRKANNLRLSKRSYGNSAFEDPNLRTHSLSIPDLATFVQNKYAIYDEFKEIPVITSKIDEIPLGCEDKNRYANVIPLPETRVHLQQIHNDEKSEYINANYVKGPSDTTNYYIATQAPMESTVSDFWRMVWEQKIRVIIMSTDLTEGGVEKCFEYLPPSVVLDNIQSHGEYQVTLKSREVKEKYALSTVHLKNLTTRTWREIIHLWYSWPETGVPVDETSIIAMLLEARSFLRLSLPEQNEENNVNTKTTNNNEEIEMNGKDSDKNEFNSIDKNRSLQRVQGPLLVHCSPGTSRTGTIIACDIILRELEAPPRQIDIARAVYSVRRGRASAVQTKQQYEFIYKVAHIYATKLTGPNID